MTFIQLHRGRGLISPLGGVLRPIFARATLDLCHWPL